MGGSFHSYVNVYQRVNILGIGKLPWQIAMTCLGKLPQPSTHRGWIRARNWSPRRIAQEVQLTGLFPFWAAPTAQFRWFLARVNHVNHVNPWMQQPRPRFSSGRRRWSKESLPILKSLNSTSASNPARTIRVLPVVFDTWAPSIEENWIIELGVTLSGIDQQELGHPFPNLFPIPS